MSIVDELLAQPGLYVGIDDNDRSETGALARLQIAVLPGRSGVSIDYEIFHVETPEHPRSHAEHTVIGRTQAGGALMIVADVHMGTLTILHEGEPGVFEAGDEPNAYPMKAVLSVPAPGRLRHSWWYGPPGQDLVEHDVAELSLVE